MATAPGALSDEAGMSMPLTDEQRTPLVRAGQCLAFMECLNDNLLLPEGGSPIEMLPFDLVLAVVARVPPATNPYAGRSALPPAALRISRVLASPPPVARSLFVRSLPQLLCPATPCPAPAPATRHSEHPSAAAPDCSGQVQRRRQVERVLRAAHRRGRRELGRPHRALQPDRPVAAAKRRRHCHPRARPALPPAHPPGTAARARPARQIHRASAPGTPGCQRDRRGLCFYRSLSLTVYKPGAQSAWGNRSGQKYDGLTETVKVCRHAAILRISAAAAAVALASAAATAPVPVRSAAPRTLCRRAPRLSRRRMLCRSLDPALLPIACSYRERESAE